MQRLLSFIYRYRSFFTFIILEILCLLLIVRNNRFQSAAFFNSSNFISASILSFSTNVRDYFYLEEINKQLAEENARLRKLVEQGKLIELDSLVTDSVQQFSFITAKVVNNSTKWQNNSITINKGRMDGISEGMGVLGSGGIVGKVLHESERFSVVTSLLHTRFTVSSRIKDKVELCTVEWDGEDPDFVQIKYVPRHHKIEPGDSVFTSGYNSIFPSNIPIAIVREVTLPEDATFYTLDAELVNDFSTLSFVHVVVNRFKVEKDSLELLIPHE